MYAQLRKYRHTPWTVRDKMLAQLLSHPPRTPFVYLSGGSSCTWWTRHREGGLASAPVCNLWSAVCCYQRDLSTWDPSPSDTPSTWSRVLKIEDQVNKLASSYFWSLKKVFSRPLTAIHAQHQHDQGRADQQFQHILHDTRVLAMWGRKN